MSFLMEEQEYLDALKSDFRNFLSVTWETLSLPEPSRVQYDIADYLQSDNPRLMIQAMRGAGKSYITSCFAVWCLFRNPDATIICISAVQNRSREFIRLARKIIDSLPFLHHLTPNPEDRDGADRFDVGCRTTPSKNPSVAAYGIKSMITGSHADIIICDDVEIPQNSMTVEARELLLNRCKELESVLNPGGRIIFLGTPQSFDSVYRHLGRSYPVRRWTARYPDPDTTQAENLAPMLLDDLAKGTHQPGDPTYPSYYSNETLLEREAIMGTSNFMLQMMLDTTLADSQKFPLLFSNLIIHPVSPLGGSPKVLHGTLNPFGEIETPSIHPNDKFYKAMYYEPVIKDWTQVLMGIDPSGKGRDSTAVVIVCELNGMVHLGAVKTYSDGFSPETMEDIASLIAHWNVKTLLIESNYGGGMWTSLLMPHLPHPCDVQEVRNATQKELRILDTIQPIVESHRLVVAPEVLRNSDFLYQYSHISRVRGSLKNDDILDALTLPLSHLTPHLRINPQDIAKEKAEREQAKEIKDFLASYQRTLNPNAGGKPQTHGWMGRNGGGRRMDALGGRRGSGRGRGWGRA